MRPIGLGARDSLRIEAGLPLYGHELAGPLDLRPDDAGFAGYVKLHKPFFVGRRDYVEHAGKRKMTVVRFRIEEKGVRVPKQEDVVTESHGRVIGQVTSCAMDTEGYLVGQAYVDQRNAEEGTEIVTTQASSFRATERSVATEGSRGISMLRPICHCKQIPRLPSTTLRTGCYARSE